MLLCSHRNFPKLFFSPGKISFIQSLGLHLIEISSPVLPLNEIYFNILFYLLFYCFETGSFYLAMTILEHAVQTRLGLNSKRSVCLCLQRAGLKGISSCLACPVLLVNGNLLSHFYLTFVYYSTPLCLLLLKNLQTLMILQPSTLTLLKLD